MMVRNGNEERSSQYLENNTIGDARGNNDARIVYIILFDERI